MNFGTSRNEVRKLKKFGCLKEDVCYQYWTVLPSVSTSYQVAAFSVTPRLGGRNNHTSQK